MSDRTGLVNLVAEIEARMTGSAKAERLPPPLASTIPDAECLVFVLFDGLGSAQLGHPAAAPLQRHARGTLDAPWPTTTTVSLSTVATGMPPVSHGTIGHFMALPDHGIVNVLKWIRPGGVPVTADTASFLPSPNLWERLRSADVEALTIQPADFEGSPLSRALYRGCRFEPVRDLDDWVDAASTLAVGRRLIFAYLPHVDLAAHIGGQASHMYTEAMQAVATAWDRLVERLPHSVALVGTADHGHIDYGDDQKILVTDRRYDALQFFGDTRSLMVRGKRSLIDELATETGCGILERQEFLPLLGEGPPHPDLEARLPDAVLTAPPGHIVVPRGFDRRLVGYHGGLAPAEREIPLLVRA